jgi:hypothetical protein
VPIHWTLWTDITERPLLLQVQIVTEAPDRSPVGGKKIKLIVTERFLDWDLAPELGEETFRFRPPEGAKEVKVLFEGMSQAGDLRSENAAP